MPRRKPQARLDGGEEPEGAPIAILQPFAAHVQRLRLERNLPQEVLAERAGISTQHLGLIEGAFVDPRASTLIGLADAFEANVGKLFETTGPRGTPVNQPPPLSRKRATRRSKR